MPRPRKKETENKIIERMFMTSLKHHVISEIEVLSLEILKDLITNEFLKVKNELKNFRQVFMKIDSHLSLLESKFDAFDKMTLQLQKDVKGLCKEVNGIGKLEKQVKLKENLDQLDDDFEAMQQTVENDNNRGKIHA